MSVDQLNQEEQEERASLTATLSKRLMSVRVSYALVVIVVGWFALALVLYFMRVLGFVDGR